MVVLGMQNLGAGAVQNRTRQVKRGAMVQNVFVTKVKLCHVRSLAHFMSQNII